MRSVIPPIHMSRRAFAGEQGALPDEGEAGRVARALAARQARRRRRAAIHYLRAGAIVMFGVLFPLALLIQAFMTVGRSDVNANLETIGIEKTVPPQLAKLAKPEDYTLYALIYMETSNRRVMLNKQMMKMAVIHIGFAVISVGMMLMLLGIDAGGMDLEGEHKALGGKINLKIASSGIVVFVVGATMAALGGLTINQYSTGEIPIFGSDAARSVPISTDQMLTEYDRCHRAYVKPLQARACLANWMDDTIRKETP